jgi:lantibiotic modifying enzyme
MSTRPTTFRPLVDGAEREAALATTATIVTQLRGLDRDRLPVTLYEGAAGQALLFGALAELWPDRDYEEDARQLLERAAAGLAEQTIDAGLFEGYTGVAFATAHLGPLLYEEPSEEVLVEIDDSLRELINAPPTDLASDVMGGLAGFVIYGLSASGERGLALARAAIAELTRRAVREDGRAAWTTGSLPPSFNLGTGHGQPGVLVALAAAVRAGIDAQNARQLLDDGAAWLLARMRDDREYAFDRYFAAGYVQERPTRLGWCYGDASTAAALACIGTALDEPRWVTVARDLGLRAAARAPDSVGIVDAGLCHGAAGLLHIFNRLWQYTDEPRFAEVARAWLRRTLAYATARDGFDPLTGLDWEPPQVGGLVTGSAGVAAALAAATSDREPWWDRALALSLP